MAEPGVKFEVPKNTSVPEFVTQSTVDVAELCTYDLLVRTVPAMATTPLGLFIVNGAKPPTVAELLVTVRFWFDVPFIKRAVLNEPVVSVVLAFHTTLP